MRVAISMAATATATATRISGKEEAALNDRQKANGQWVAEPAAASAISECKETEAETKTQRRAEERTKN